MLKFILEFLKCVTFVFGTYVGFAFPWALFYYSVNPYFVGEIMDQNYEQSWLHLLALDTLDFILNWSVFFWWIIAAIVFFLWLKRKKSPRAGLRRIGIAIYVLPYVALTFLLVSAALVQNIAEPDTSASTSIAD